VWTTTQQKRAIPGPIGIDKQNRGHSLPSQVVMTQAERMFHVLCDYHFSMASNTIDSFDPFNIFEPIEFPLTVAFQSLAFGTAFGTALALEKDAMLRSQL
jgi:hypothetical protein